MRKLTTNSFTWFDAGTGTRIHNITDLNSTA